jgi:hypothetical protein
VSAATRPPLDRLRRQVGEVVVTDCRTLTLGYDGIAGQVVLEGLPSGPAGEGGLSLAEGIELIFDCADGRLSRVFIDAGEPGGLPSIGEPAMAAVASLFGAQARTAIQQAASRAGDPATLAKEPGAFAALSRLARLDAARVTSPMADSPFWAVEAALLAWRAGLDSRVKAETRWAVNALQRMDDASLDVLAAATDAIANLVQAAEPELAKRLRERALVSEAGGSAGIHHMRRPLVISDITAEGEQSEDESGGLQWWLDPRLVPPGLFRRALWPEAELTVRTEGNGLVVEAELAPNADRQVLAHCRARLVDSVDRSVVGSAPFRHVGDSRVQAEMREPLSRGDKWVEVVDDDARPVLGGQLRHSRRAVRWADAALGACRQASGLADAEWVKLAATAWGRCAEDWAAADDPDRAYLAAVRRAAIRPGVVVPNEPSAWAKELAGRPLLVEEPFLAERTGC